MAAEHPSLFDNSFNEYAYTIDDIRGVMHLTFKKAAEDLNVTESNLRKICRAVGVIDWPSRKIASSVLKIQSLETILATSTGLSQDKRDQYQKQIEDLAKYIESVTAHIPFAYTVEIEPDHPGVSSLLHADAIQMSSPSSSSNQPVSSTTTQSTTRKKHKPAKSTVPMVKQTPCSLGDSSETMKSKYQCFPITPTVSHADNLMQIPSSSTSTSKGSSKPMERVQFQLAKYTEHNKSPRHFDLPLIQPDIFSNFQVDIPISSFAAFLPQANYRPVSMAEYQVYGNEDLRTPAHSDVYNEAQESSGYSTSTVPIHPTPQEQFFQYQPSQDTAVSSLTSTPGQWTESMSSMSAPETPTSTLQSTDQSHQSHVFGSQLPEPPQHHSPVKYDDFTTLLLSTPPAAQQQQQQYTSTPAVPLPPPRCAADTHPHPANAKPKNYAL